MNMMRKFWAAAVLTLGLGCASNTAFVEWPNGAPAGVVTREESNPVFLPLGKENYAQVFEKVLSVLDNFGFEIQESNRWDGRIETVPRIAPGLILFAKPGSPDLRERTLATLQTYRHRVSVNIQPAQQGGYFVEVQARKELEDLPKPIRSTVGSAIFRTDNNVDRQFEVIDATSPGMGWIAKGRDSTLEQEILVRIKNCL